MEKRFSQNFKKQPTATQATKNKYKPVLLNQSSQLNAYVQKRNSQQLKNNQSIAPIQLQNIYPEKSQNNKGHLMQNQPRTISVNLVALQQSNSQQQLYYSQQINQSVGDNDESQTPKLTFNQTKYQLSFREQVDRLVGGQSPQNKKNFQYREYPYYSHNSPNNTKNKKLLIKEPHSQIKINHKAQLSVDNNQNINNVFHTKDSNRLFQKYTSLPKQSLNLNKSLKVPHNGLNTSRCSKNKPYKDLLMKHQQPSKLGIKSIKTSSINLTQSNQPITQQFIKESRNYQQSNNILANNQKVSSQNFKSFQSPRFQTINTGLTTGGTMSSQQSAKTESINNNSQFFSFKEKNIHISEKLAPKEKKKRTITQRQPKQGSIQKNNIKNQEEIYQVYSSYQRNQYYYNLERGHQRQFSNPISQSQEINFEQNPSDSLNQEQLKTQQLMYLNQIPQTPLKDPKKLNNRLFNKKVSIRSKNISEVISEEYQQETLGNQEDLKRSFNHEDLRGLSQLATPVFRENHRGGITCNQINLSNKKNKENKVKLKNSPKIKQQRTKTLQAREHKDQQYNIFNKDHHIDENILKKVFSAHDIGALRHLQNSQIHDQRQKRAQSSNSFINRLKSYFKGKRIQNEVLEEKSKIQYRCNCGLSGENYACQRALKWLKLTQNYSEKEYKKNKELYEGLLRLDTTSGSESQIERDIPRTFPNIDPFMSTFEGQSQLSRVLNAFSKYFSAIGYVQGMNFVVASLLMHCSEDIAFWLFVSLIEDYEMRDIYQPNLPGLFKHSQILQLLIMEHLEDLYDHFLKHSILIEMYTSDWIFALFSNIIPITQYHYFLEQFFIGGWFFFYKFSLTFLKCLQYDLINFDDISDILATIKLKFTKEDYIFLKDHNQDQQQQQQQANYSESYQQNSINRQSSLNRSNQNISQVKNLLGKLIGIEQSLNSESFKNDNIWEKIVQISCVEWENEFNENFVMQLLANFDTEKLVFKQSINSSLNRKSQIVTSTYHMDNPQIHQNN